MKKILSLLFVSSVIVGCGQEVKSQQYYYEHLDEAKEKVQFCKTADKSNKDVLHDCMNASGAITQKMFKNGMKTPPPYGTYKINTSF